jgi:protein-L-isoaspartate O-methyltransferase
MSAAKPARPPLEAVLAVAVVSFTILAAELALTRCFSVLFRAPYVFLIVSGAIGGLGLGGLLVQFVPEDEERVRRWVVTLCVLLAAALAGPVLFLFASPWGREVVARAETAVVVLLPMATFAIAGMVLALIWRQYPAHGGFLYAVDLAWAAAAAPASVWLLDRLGGINTPLVLAVAAALVGAVLAFRGRRVSWVGLSLLSVIGLGVVLGTNLAVHWIDLPTLKAPQAALQDPSHPWNLTTKPLYQELATSVDARIVRTDWTAVSRTDVVYDKRQDLHYVYTDGDVPTQMAAWDGSLETARREYAPFIGSLPYRLLGRAPDRVLAIGAGGGLDVLIARAFGAAAVDAVEINPSIPAIVADPRFDRTYARAYQAPGVRLIVDEGRSFLQRAGKYDVIYFACAKTATTQTGGTALLDNHLYTVEAFRDYWRHLSDGGLVALVTQEPFLIDRLLVTGFAALRAEGVADPAPHLLSAGVPPERIGEGPYRYVLLLRRQAWTRPDTEGIRRALVTNWLRPIYIPFVRPRGAGDGEFDPAGRTQDVLAALERQYPLPNAPGRFASLRPVTDDSPFYVDVAPGLHPTLAGLLWGSVTAATLVLALVGGIGAASLRRSARRGDQSRRGALTAAMVYFSMLGAGFILVEVALIQRFIVLLGFPTRSLSVSLFAILLSSALGAAFAQRGEPAQAARRLRRLLPVLILLLLLYRVLLPPFIDSLLAQPLALRVAATALALLPAGFLMGMPFPTALRLLPRPLGRLVPAFWSVNGVTTILGSVATMALAKFIGYSGALLVGAACYGVAWLALPLLEGTPTPDAEAEAVPA